MPTRTDAGRDARVARGARWLPLVAALALGLTLSACDRCGDFFWEKQPATCKAMPPPG